MTSDNATVPNYDLVNFKDSIPPTLTSVKISAARPIAQENPKSNNGFLNNRWLWPVLIAVLLMLGFLTFGLTRDLAKRT